MSRTVANARWRGKRPALSVLIPFYRDDPCDLLRDLNDEAGQVGRSVEVIVLSDGGGDADLVARVEAAIKALSLPARLIDLKTNEGRSRGRNRLAAAVGQDDDLHRAAHLTRLVIEVAQQIAGVVPVEGDQHRQGRALAPPAGVGDGAAHASAPRVL